MMRIERARDAGGKRCYQKALALIVDDRDAAGAGGIFVLGNCLERAPEARMG